MTKIFEALEQAENEKAVNAGAGSFDKPAAMTRRIRSASPVESTMIGLYQGIHNALPDAESRVVCFVGATKSCEASVLVSKFVQVAADKLDLQVLYVGVRQAKGKSLVSVAGGSEGLCDGIGDGAVLDSAITTVGDTGLHVASLFGSDSDGTAARINTPGLQALLTALRERFDLIVFDPPPADMAPDALALANHCDGSVLVVEAERTRWQVADAVRARLEEQGAKVLGAVLKQAPILYSGNSSTGASSGRDLRIARSEAKSVGCAPNSLSLPGWAGGKRYPPRRGTSNGYESNTTALGAGSFGNGAGTMGNSGASLFGHGFSRSGRAGMRSCRPNGPLFRGGVLRCGRTDGRCAIGDTVDARAGDPSALDRQVGVARRAAYWRPALWGGIGWRHDGGRRHPGAAPSRRVRRPELLCFGLPEN